MHGGCATCYTTALSVVVLGMLISWLFLR